MERREVDDSSSVVRRANRPRLDPARPVNRAPLSVSSDVAPLVIHSVSRRIYIAVVFLLLRDVSGVGSCLIPVFISSNVVGQRQGGPLNRRGGKVDVAP